MLSAPLVRVDTWQGGVAVTLYVCMCWGGSMFEWVYFMWEQHFSVCHTCAVANNTRIFVVLFAKRNGSWSFMPLFIQYTRTESDRRVEINIWNLWKCIQKFMYCELGPCRHWSVVEINIVRECIIWNNLSFFFTIRWFSFIWLVIAAQFTLAL